MEHQSSSLDLVIILYLDWSRLVYWEQRRRRQCQLKRRLWPSGSKHLEQPRSPPTQPRSKRFLRAGREPTATRTAMWKIRLISSRATAGNSKMPSLAYQDPIIRVVGDVAIVRFHWLGESEFIPRGQEELYQSAHLDELAKAGRRVEAALACVHQTLTFAMGRARRRKAACRWFACVPGEPSPGSDSSGFLFFRALCGLQRNGTDLGRGHLYPRSARSMNKFPSTPDYRAEQIRPDGPTHLRITARGLNRSRAGRTALEAVEEFHEVSVDFVEVLRCRPGRPSPRPT